MRPIDLTGARLAGDQKELITRDVLLDAGCTRDAIAHRVATGRMRRVHPGVYTTCVTELSFEQRALAAVLACGAGSALHDGWSAGLWRMLTEPAGPPTVVHAGRHRRGPVGVRLRVTTRPEHTVHRGVPVTTAARTLLDLATTGSLGRLELALNEALARKLVSYDALERLTTSGRRGSRALRAVLEDAPGYTREAAERRLRALILKAQLPRPRFNARVEGHEADALWLERRLIAEVDGYATHRRRVAFEHDRRLDQRRTVAGYRTIRVTWWQLLEQPEAVVASLAAALARA